MKKLWIGIGVAVGLMLAAITGAVGFWYVGTAFAQGPTPLPGGFPGYAACQNNSAVLSLLGLSQQELLAQRQAGKSLLDIAKAKEVSEDKLLDALIQPVNSMHTWMGQAYGNSGYADQMTQWMRDQTAKDIRETKLGTMTDNRIGLGGGAFGPGFGMMGGAYNTGTYGPGMMGGQFNSSAGYGGMMRGGMMGGMMGRWR